MSDKGWIGVDLDGTLARYDGWISETHIGEPIHLMVERVKKWISEGKDVRIFTARVNPDRGMNKDGSQRDFSAVRWAIEEWCVIHIGRPLPVTCTKDYDMAVLWDDRCVQVIPNTGMTVEEWTDQEFIEIERKAFGMKP